MTDLPRQDYYGGASVEGEPPPPLPSPDELMPAESMALTVALAQLRRGDTPPPNTAAACIFALARLTGREP